MKNNISFTMDISETDIAGYLFIIGGIASMFLRLETTVTLACIGAATTLLGVAKIANTSYDNSHKDIQP